ncbi:MAG: response regulator [Spirochaetota bacterium]
MEDVEQLLAQLLAGWEVDLYARVERDAQSGQYAPLAWSGAPDPDVAALLASPIVQDACERSEETTVPVIVNDLAGDAHGASPAVALGFQALAALPVDPTAREAGILVFGSRRSDAISDATVALLRRFAALVASYHGERGRGAQQLRRLVIRLTEAEVRERKRIAALLHDDLQQTLAGIKVHIDMAARRSGGAAFVAERLDTAVRLIEQAIERSRTLSHELSPPMLRSRGLVPALKMLASETEQFHGLRVRVNEDPGEMALSELASMVVYRAIQELVLNVVKHAHVNEAAVDVTRGPDGVRLVVRDHGRGFDVNDVMKHDRPAGFGLVSIRERVEAIGGVFEIDSTPGSGSRFTISLPPEAMRAQGTLDRGDRAAEAGATGNRPTTVLLVDDHAVIRQGLAFLLNEEPDLEVVGEADSGTTALEIVRELSPDVVVMDLTMPTMSGDEATRRLLREAPETRVVGLSMHSDDEARERMLAAGAAAYLPKAGPSSDLVAAIRGKRSE